MLLDRSSTCDPENVNQLGIHLGKCGYVWNFLDSGIRF
jgi:hypothetical protein